MTDSIKAALQHARFLETARQLGCDEDEAAFDAKLKAVVRPGSKSPISRSGGPIADEQEPSG